MKTQKFIFAELVKSNKSKNYVWVVYTTKKDRHYAKNALKALKLAFIIKKQTGCPIDNATFQLLKSQAASIRPDSAESPSVPEQVTASETAPTANA